MHFGQKGLATTFHLITTLIVQKLHLYVDSVDVSSWRIYKCLNRSILLHHIGYKHSVHS